MNLKDLQNKSVLLFGKSRAFGSEEFESQMKFHKITLCKEYNSGVVLVVEGKMMSPYEHIASDELYRENSKEIEFISIDDFEKELAKYIDADTLLMSLKLSHDKQRLKSFLQNSTLGDELFLKLLKMYSWRGEDFFGSDDNRDVSAAIILRFYKNIERNHNVQYATSGFMHLLAQTDNSSLIAAIAELEPLQKSFTLDVKSSNYTILTAIATQTATPKSVLNLFIKKSSSYIKTIIAMRDDCDEEMQIALYNSMDEDVHEALSYNFNLCETLLRKLIDQDKFAHNIALHVRLNIDFFETLLQKYPQELAQNGSLSIEMQAKLLSLHVQGVKVALASNFKIDKRILLELLREDTKEVKSAIYKNSATSQTILENAYEKRENHFSLACNENTPKHILKRLGDSFDKKVLRALAQNESTPVEILYQLQLDSALARVVKENPAFGKYIQQNSIGWEV
ncbi:hypothetical protein [Candidatus Sulfurimonas baltica]|uniref:Leucine rich repeat variant n=1 Tax=Candidatus Sulfurimonas baltica TaxID=2740404 RepID=A0A7S7RNG8_9BACT|nr:hypothetical protein [Candidatus Sulfurimonas baltica]QOY52408.1 hypothetical protein HUE88_01550 [Candidatus Sulfurimonas baltica]